MNDHHTALMIVNMDEVSQIPVLAEPWFLHFDAEVEFHPVIMVEDLAKANLEDLGKKWRQWFAWCCEMIIEIFPTN